MIIAGFSGAINYQKYIEKYGVRYVGHDSSIAIIKDGEIIYAAEEERFSKEKHTGSVPFLALKNALEFTGISAPEIDYFAFPWQVNMQQTLKIAINHFKSTPLIFWPNITKTGINILHDAFDEKRIFNELKSLSGLEIKAKVKSVPHHVSHIASSFYLSPFQESAVLSVDGNGGDVSALMGIWNSNGFKKIKAINSPQSIGVQYGLITEFLGFRSGYDEYKVMGMAAYGDPSRFIKAFDKILAYENGKLSSLNAGLIFKLNYCLQALEKILGIKKRTPFAEIKTEHFDLAAALQKATEKILSSIVNELKDKSGSNNLCLSGGVFMNSVANGLIKEQAVFDNIYIPPVPADNGTALGAAFWLWHSLGKAKIQQPQTVYFGPHFSDQQIENCLQNEQNELAFYKSENIVNEAVEILADNKVIGWFQGRMELGARALGNRSILANCAYAEMKDRINILIKNRENFRPFAGSVPLENVNDFFEFENESPYMQMVVNIKEDKRDLIKAIDHFGTCRIQTVKKEENPLFHQLLTAFGGRTGLPVLLNTSFNVNDSPIVCSPADAIHAFKRMNLDALVIGNYIVKKLSFSI